MRLLIYSAAGVFLLFLVLGDAGWGQASDTSFLDTVKAATDKYNGRSVHQVQQVVQPTVLAKEDGQRGPFRVLARKQEIGRFACSSCHNATKVQAQNAVGLTHGDVVVRHGQEGSGLACIDCHHPEDPDFLEDKKGNKIDYDHSYQLCGQCHFRQKRDWLGGAHGKRVEYWAGDRVVFNCTTCHNPHAPRFAKRFPATYSVPTN